MITITNNYDITAILEKYQSGRDGSYPTSRCMPSPWDDAQEWAEYGDVEGLPAKVYYIFENSDVADLEPDSYDWSQTYISKIELAEMDENEEYETI